MQLIYSSDFNNELSETAHVLTTLELHFVHFYLK